MVINNRDAIGVQGSNEILQDASVMDEMVSKSTEDRLRWHIATMALVDALVELQEKKGQHQEII